MADQKVRCPQCGRSLLYGLLAAPIHDPALLERAARVLGAVPGGPGMPEARRRLASGAPLAVGLSRADTEELQDKLVGLGLVPRIGPAPEGTPPLAASDRRLGRGLLIAAAAAIAIATALALQIWREASPPHEPDAVASPLADAPPQPASEASGSAPREEPVDDAIPPARRLELWAQLRTEAAGLQLIGLVRGRGGEDPDGPLTLVGRVAGLEVVNESFEKPPVQIQRRGGDNAPLLIRSVPFRIAVESARLEDARELVLEARWGEWRSAPLVVRLPGGV